MKARLNVRSTVGREEKIEKGEEGGRPTDIPGKKVPRGRGPILHLCEGKQDRPGPMRRMGGGRPRASLSLSPKGKAKKRGGGVL